MIVSNLMTIREISVGISGVDDCSPIMPELVYLATLW